MGTVNGVDIRVGQVWKTRGGETARVLSTTGGLRFPVLATINGLIYSYVTTGLWTGDASDAHSRDLVTLLQDAPSGCSNACAGCACSEHVPNRESVEFVDGEVLPATGVEDDTGSAPRHHGAEPGKHGSGAFTARPESVMLAEGDPIPVPEIDGDTPITLSEAWAAEDASHAAIDPRFAAAHYGHDLRPGDGLIGVPVEPTENGALRQFTTGATRSSDAGRYDPEGFLSPIAIERFSQYMAKHQRQADGSLRSSDNWQKGIPLPAYMKGGWRHFLHLWTRHRGYPVQDPMAAADMEEDLCALMFNGHGMLHEVVKARLETEGGAT